MQKGLWATLRGHGDQRSSHGSVPYPSLATAFNVNVRNAAGGRGRTFGWEMVSSKKEKYQSSTGTVEAKGVSQLVWGQRDVLYPEQCFAAFFPFGVGGDSWALGSPLGALAVPTRGCQLPVPGGCHMLECSSLWQSCGSSATGPRSCRSSVQIPLCSRADCRFRSPLQIK